MAAGAGLATPVTVKARLVAEEDVGKMPSIVRILSMYWQSTGEGEIPQVQVVAAVAW